MKKLLSATFAVLATMVVVAGCSGGGGGGETGANGKPAPYQEVTEVPKDGGVPAGGIVLRPKNPNDPHFKPDPSLGGVGGGN